MGHKIAVNNGGVLTVNDTRTLDEAKADRLHHLSDHRWRTEGAGCATSLGFRSGTDDRAKALLHGLHLRASADPDATFTFKGENGGWYRLTSGQAIKLCHEVHAFVQACFAQEQKVAAQIMAAETNEAADAVDFTQGWPS